MAEEVELGRVDKFEVGIEDHGIFGFNIGLDFGGSYQGTGWYSVERTEPLKRLYNFFGVSDHHDAKGLYVFAHRAGHWDKIEGLSRTKQEGGAFLLLSDLFKG